ncbi:MAG: PAS domain S-box protein [Verrucomicrobia bacterium]|nr:PAS domain S-box protein [Verrucomicrobiota bacterium]
MNHRDVRNFLFGTLRGRLILSVAVVHSVMMTLFIFDLTVRQRVMLLDNQADEAAAMSQALAMSAAGWIAAHDIAGLQELVEAERRYPEMLFALLADEGGHVLAHTDKSKLGKYLLDLPKDVQQTTLSRTPVLVDVAVPAMLGNRHVGWARVGIGQKTASQKLAQITQSGVMYALAAIVIGSFIAWLMGRRITRRLYAVQETINKVRAGNRLARSSIAGTDEAALMASEFNSMLDAVAERDAELRASEEKYRGLIQRIQAAVIVHGADTRILTSNRLAQQLLGFTEEQMRGKLVTDPDWHFIREDGTAMSLEEYPVSRVLTTKQPLRDAVLGVHRRAIAEDAWVLVSADPELDEQGKITQVVVTFVDITARRKAEEERKRAEEKSNQLAAIVESSDDAIIGKTLDGIITSWNRGAEKIYGYAESEVIGKPITILVPPGCENEVPLILARIKSGGHIEHYEAVRCREDGRVIRVSLTISPVRDADGGIVGASTIARDITEHKRAAEALRAAYVYNRSLIEASLDPLVTIGHNGKITDVNAATEAATGCSRAELIGTDFSDYFTEPEKARAGYEQVYREGAVRDYPLELRNRDGRLISVLYNASVYRDEKGGVVGVFAAARDITARKRAEEELRRVNRALRMLSDSNQTLIRTTDEATLLNEICRIVVEVGGYRMAWVGFAEHDEAKTVRPVAQAGFESGYLESVNLTWADDERGRGPGGIAIRSGQPCVVRSIPDDPAFAPWREDAIRRGYQSMIALPLSSENQTFGALGIYAAEVEAFDAREVEILKELAGDLAFGIVALRTRAERELAEETLEKERKRMEVILSALDTGLSLINPDMTIAWVNQKVREMFPGREPVGQVCHVFYESRATVCEGCGTLRAFKDGKVCESEQLVPATGRWYYIISQPIKDKAGRVVNVLEGITDITERKQAETALRENEARLSMALEVSNAGEWEWNIESDEVCFDTRFHAMLGYAPGELPNTLQEWKPYHHPEDLPAMLSKAGAYLRGDSPTYENEHRIRTKAGTWKWVFTRGKLVNLTSTGSPKQFIGMAMDVTEHKRVEDALRDSEESFRSLVEQSTLSIQVLSPDGRTLQINHAFETLWGITLKDLANYNLLADQQLVRLGLMPYIQRAFSGEATSIPSAEYSAKDSLGTGDKKWVQARIYPVKDNAGNIRQVILIHEDITERKRAEAALIRAKEEWERTFDAVPDLIALIDTNHHIIRANRAMAEQLGSTPGQVVGSYCYEAVHGMSAPPSFCPHSKLLVSGREARVEVVEERLGGTFDVSTTPLHNETGKLVGCVHVARNITKRKQAEAALRQSEQRKTILNQIAHIFLTVPDEEIYAQVLSVVLQAMKSKFGIFGFIGTNGDLVIPSLTGEVWSECQVSGKSVVFSKATWGESLWGRAIRESKTFCSDGPFHTPKGHIRIDHFLAVPIVFGNTSIGLLSVANAERSYTKDDTELLESIAGSISPILNATMQRDSQEQKRQLAEEEVRKLNAELELRVIERTAQLQEANKELEAFSYSVSHDLRAPLRAIDGFANMLVEDHAKQLDEEGQRELGVISHETKRMGQLIDDLLSFSRMSRQSAQLAEVDMEALAQEVFNECAARASGRKLQFKLHPLPPARCDRALLRHVLVNLISNAIKYSRPKTVAEIEMGGRTENSELLYYVKDNGVGFDMKYVSRLFGVFQRLHREEEFEGTGVGLAIVQRVIHRHGGRVWAESTLNEGATFYFTLPVRKAQP